MGFDRYDPRFYEVRARWFFAKTRRLRLSANVRLPLPDVPWSRRPEIDGLYQDSDGQVAVEIKSYGLTAHAQRDIERRYHDLGFRRLVIIAPSFDDTVSFRRTTVQCIRFRPTLEVLRAHYATTPTPPTEPFASWLRPGGIHFRYALANLGSHSRGFRRTLNQVDKNICSAEKLTRELRRRVLPHHIPFRVLWSPTRLVVPKDAYFHRRPQYVCHSPLVFDVDGYLVHRAMFPCTVEPDHGLCMDCLALAKEHAARLAECLDDAGCEPAVVFSGRSGFHVYALRNVTQDQRINLLRRLLRRRVVFDRQVTTARLPIVAFPATIHGAAMRPLVRVDSLSDFDGADLPALGEPWE